MRKKQFQIQFKTQSNEILTRTVDANSEKHAVHIINEQQDRSYNYVKEFLAIKEFPN